MAEDKAGLRRYMRIGNVLIVLGALLLPGCTVLQGGFEEEIYLQPGESIDLRLGAAGCCYFILPLLVPTIWTMSANDVASLDSLTGHLQIHDDAPDGATFTVSGGGATATVYVYDPALNPVVGYWSEVARIDCDTLEEFVPESGIMEVVFLPSRRFSVTWQPFELYKDYWGTYTIDAQTGYLEMTIEGGNFIPQDFDGEGSIQIGEGGAVTLLDIWLGSRTFFGETPEQAVSCGHRLIGGLVQAGLQAADGTGT